VKHLLALIFIFQFLSGQAHTVVTFQPDSVCGQDALVTSLWPNTNSGASTDFIACAWTNQGNPSNIRALLNFDFATIPAGATVISATLELFHYASPNNTGHSNLSGPAICYLERIVTPWTENSVTWNTQPATTSINALTLPAPTSNTQNYSINVISIVQDILANPTGSFGFMLRQQNESYYRSLLFASSDVSTSALRPKLTIIYDLNISPLAGCYSNFVITQPAPPSTPGTDPVVHFPNVFTPNGDGKNDFFFADTFNVRVEKFTVNNRWGEVVYETKSAFPWDGNFKGKPCSDGTYYYSFSYEWEGELETVTGFVTLIR
jgi:gliding motility-associated-like protein